MVHGRRFAAAGCSPQCARPRGGLAPRCLPGPDSEALLRDPPGTDHSDMPKKPSCIYTDDRRIYSRVKGRLEVALLVSCLRPCLAAPLPAAGFPDHPRHPQRRKVCPLAGPPSRFILKKMPPPARRPRDQRSTGRPLLCALEPLASGATAGWCRLDSRRKRQFWGPAGHSAVLCRMHLSIRLADRRSAQGRRSNHDGALGANGHRPA